MTLQKELSIKCKDFGREGFLKIAIDTDQADLKQLKAR